MNNPYRNRETTAPRNRAIAIDREILSHLRPGRFKVWIPKEKFIELTQINHWTPNSWQEAELEGARAVINHYGAGRYVAGNDPRALADAFINVRRTVNNQQRNVTVHFDVKRSARRLINFGQTRGRMDAFSITTSKAQIREILRPGFFAVVSRNGSVYQTATTNLLREIKKQQYNIKYI
jgi:hypothetical protein